MKVTLIYPPSDCRNNECFLMPSISTPVLANYLKNAGHDVTQLDFDISFHKMLKPKHKDVDFGILRDQCKVLDYLHDRLDKAESARLRRIESMFIGSQHIEKCGLYGITLVDLQKGLFILNSAALIANGIKKICPAPVVLGFVGIPQEAYRDILEKYPVFDYAIWGFGEISLLKLTEWLSGKGGRLTKTFARKQGSVVKHGWDNPDVKCEGLDYKSYPLDMYRVSSDDLFKRYDSNFPFIDQLRSKTGNREQIISMYRFETTCRGRCIFCGIDHSAKSDCMSIDEIMKDLHELSALGVTGIYFTNPNFNNNYKFTEELCDRMIKANLDLQWCDCVNFREIDENLLLKMKKSGAVRLVFGMETGSSRLLKYIRKGVTKEKIQKLLRYSHSLGIWNSIELIGGFPTETDADIAETSEFIRANSGFIDMYAINPFYLYKMAPLFRKPEKYGIKLYTGDSDKDVDYFAADGGVGNVSERFDEINGLSWREKDAQIRNSTRALAETVAEVASFGAISQDHTHLLMCLYRRFGHSNPAGTGP